MSTFATAMAGRESPVVRLVRRAAIVVACLYMVSFGWSIFRRLRQVLRVDVHTSSSVLTPGATVGYDVVTSGEVKNRIRLELVQGPRHVVLIEQRASVNAISGLDPRMFRYTPSIRLTSAVLASFEDGPATLRLTGFGGQKLLHTPRDRVREVPVRLQRR